jgi:hypothetical protein
MESAECGLNYVPESPDDATYHAAFHDREVNGIVIEGDGWEEIWHEEDRRLLLVTKQSPRAHANVATDVIFQGYRDTRFSFAPQFTNDQRDRTTDTHAFLFCKEKRVKGIVTVGQGNELWDTNWEEIETMKPIFVRSEQPLWMITFVWRLKRFPEPGVARLMVDEVLRYLRLDVQSIGWRPPFTKDGEKFVRKCCPDRVRIVWLNSGTDWEETTLPLFDSAH